MFSFSVSSSLDVILSLCRDEVASTVLGCPRVGAAHKLTLRVVVERLGTSRVEPGLLFGPAAGGAPGELVRVARARRPVVVRREDATFPLRAWGRRAALVGNDLLLVLVEPLNALELLLLGRPSSWLR